MQIEEKINVVQIIRIMKVELSSDYRRILHEVRGRWVKFLDREDVEQLKNVFICEKNFAEKYLNRNE